MYRLTFTLSFILILSLEIIPDKSLAMLSKSKLKTEEHTLGVKRMKIFSKYLKSMYWQYSTRAVLVNGNTYVMKHFFTQQLQKNNADLNKIIMYTAMKCEYADFINNIIKIIYESSEETDNKTATQYFQNLNEKLKPTISALMEFGDVVSGLQLNEPYFLKTLLILHFYINNLTYNENKPKDRGNKLRQNSIDLTSDTDDQFIDNRIPSGMNQIKRISLQIINLIERFTVIYCDPVKKTKTTDKTLIGVDKVKDELTENFDKWVRFINNFERYSDEYDMNNALLKNCVRDDSYMKINLLKRNTFETFCNSNLKQSLVKKDASSKKISIRNLFETVENTYDVEDIYKYYKSVYEVILNIVYATTELFVSQNSVDKDLLKYFLSKLQSMNCPIELVNNCKLLINLLEYTETNSNTIDKETLMMIGNNAFKHRSYFFRKFSYEGNISNVSLFDVMESITDDSFNTFWWIFNLLRNDSETTSDYQYGVSLSLNLKLFEVNENFKCDELTKMYRNFIYFESLMNKCFSNSDTKTHDVRECFSVLVELRLRFSYNLLKILKTWSTNDYLSNDGDLLKIIVATIIYLKNKHNTDITNFIDDNKLEDIIQVKTKIKKELKLIGDVIMNLLDNYQIRYCMVIKDRYVISEEISKISQDDYIKQINFSFHNDKESFTTKDVYSTTNDESDSDDDFISHKQSDDFEIDFVRRIPKNFYDISLLTMDAIVLDKSMQYFTTKYLFNWHGELKSISKIRQFNVLENMLSLYNLADYQRLFYKWVFSSLFSMWTAIAKHILENNTSDDLSNLEQFLTHLTDLEEFLKLSFPILYEKYDKIALFNIKVFREMNLYSIKKNIDGQEKINLKMTSSKLVDVVKKIILDPVIEILGMVEETSKVVDLNTQSFGMNSIDELINLYNKLKLDMKSGLNKMKKQFIFLNAAYPIIIGNGILSSEMTSKTIKNYVIVGLENWKKNSMSVLVNGNKIVLKQFFTDKLKLDDVNNNETSTIMYTAMKCHCADSISHLLEIINQLSDRDFTSAMKYLQNIIGSVQLVITTLFEFSDVAPNNKFSEPYFLKTLLSLYLYINHLTSYNKIQSDINEEVKLKRTVQQIINLNERFMIENCYPENGLQKLALNPPNTITDVWNNLNEFLNSFKFSETGETYSIFSLDFVLLKNCTNLSFLLKTKVQIDDKWDSIINFSKQIENTYDINTVYKFLKSIYKVILKTIYKITIKTFNYNKIFPLSLCQDTLNKLQMMNCPIELINHFQLLINLCEKGLFYDDKSILKNIVDNVITPRFKLLDNVELHNSNKQRFFLSKLSMQNVLQSILSDRFQQFWWVFNLLQNDFESKSSYQYGVSLIPNTTLLTVENNVKCNQLTKMYSNFFYLENLKNECLLKEDTRVQISNASECFSSIEDKHLQFSNNLLQILDTWSENKLLSGDDDLLKIIMVTIIHLRNKNNTNLKNTNDKIENWTNAITRKIEKLKRIGDVVMNLLDNYQIRHCSVTKTRSVITDEFNKTPLDPDANIAILDFSMSVDCSSNKSIAPLNDYSEHFVIDSERKIPKNFYDLSLLTGVKNDAALSEYFLKNGEKVYFNWYGNVKRMSEILNIDVFENMLGLHQLAYYQRLLFNFITAIFYNIWKVDNESKLTCQQNNRIQILESLVENLKMLSKFVTFPFSKSYDAYMIKDEDNLALLRIKFFEELKIIALKPPSESTQGKIPSLTLNSNIQLRDLGQMINKIIVKPTMEILGVVKVSKFDVSDSILIQSFENFENFLAFELKYYIFF